MFIRKVSSYLLVSSLILTILATLTVILDGFVFKSGPANPMIFVYLALLHGLILATTSVVMFLTYRQCKSCEVSALAFHDFLIDYKATPRSKLLRKHMPSMEAVVEEASFYE